MTKENFQFRGKNHRLKFYCFHENIIPCSIGDLRVGWQRYQELDIKSWRYKLFKNALNRLVVTYCHKESRGVEDPLVFIFFSLQLRQSVPTRRLAWTTWVLSVTRKPVSPVRGGTPSPPTPIATGTYPRTITTVGTPTGARDPGVIHRTRIYVTSCAMYPFVVNIILHKL